MPGCFGRRKKKNKDKDANRSAAPEPKQQNSSHGNDSRPAAAAATQVDKHKQQQQQQQQVTPQTHAAPPPKSQQQQQQQQQQQNSLADEAPEVTETITVARSQSMHHAPPKPGNIKKAATMSRYDFLRKQDSANYADRWATLRQRYLEPKQAEEVADAADGGDANGNGVATRNGGPKSHLRVMVKSLPRRFSPPPSGVVSPVKFSGWFYERQIREEEARRESHLREERMLKIIEGPSKEDMEEAAVRIQAGYKGYKTRKEVKAKREEMLQQRL